MAVHRIDNTPDNQALKAGCGALVKAVGGVEAADGFCRAGFRRLSEYGRPDNDCFMPVDVVADLEAVAHGTVGYPQVTRLLARRAGFALVAVPQGGVTDRDLLVALAEAIKESNDVHAGLMAALADRKVTPAEAKALLSECLEAAEKTMLLHALLAQIAGEG